MASSTEEVAIFTDTNLGTHIAMAVSPDITARDFKRELAKMHFSCFPKIGEVKVYGLMVKRRSRFYHLPDSVPIKFAFQGFKGTWFLHMDARPLVDLDRPGLSQCIDAKVGNRNLDVNNVTASLITSTEKNSVVSNDKKRKTCTRASTPLSLALTRTVPLLKRRRKKEKSVNNFLECREDGIEKGCPCRNDASVLTVKDGFEFFLSQKVESAVAFNSNPSVEIRNERSSKEISASGFVKRCFSNCTEVSSLGIPLTCDVASKAVQNHVQKQMKAKTDDKCSSIQIDALPKFAVRTPPRTLPFPMPTNSGLGSPRNNSGRTGVGKRLVRASKNLSSSVCKKRPLNSFNKFKNGKLNASVSSVAKYLVFEISDEDD